MSTQRAWASLTIIRYHRHRHRQQQQHDRHHHLFPSLLPWVPAFSPIPRRRHCVLGAFSRPVHSLTSFSGFIFLVFSRHPNICPGGNFCDKTLSHSQSELIEDRGSLPRPRGLPSLCSQGPSPAPSGRSFIRQAGGRANRLTALGEACLFLLPLSKRSQMSVCFFLLCAFQKTGEDHTLVNILVPLFLSYYQKK